MTEVGKRLRENATNEDEEHLSKSREANWPSVLFFIHIHLLSLYALWLLFYEVKWITVIFLSILTSLAVLGVTAGAHRLWAHRSYEAHTGLRIFLMLCQTLAGQGSIFEWVRTHRLHHSQFGTLNDPYNYKKGFFYAHMLTRMRDLSPLQEKLRLDVDMTDLEADQVVMFQKRFYWVLYGMIFVLLPLNAPLEYWDDSVLSAVFVVGFLRYMIVLHAAWLVESGICVWGLQPGEKYPADSNSVFIITKTFWPYYHYLVPFDYKSGEYSTYDSGCSSALIRVFAALGLATHLRTLESDTIQEALADAVKYDRPIQECINDAMKKQHTPDEHYLHRQ